MKKIFSALSADIFLNFVCSAEAFQNFNLWSPRSGRKLHYKISKYGRKIKGVEDSGYLILRQTVPTSPVLMGSKQILIP